MALESRFEKRSVSLWDHMQRKVKVVPDEHHHPSVCDRTGNRPWDHWLTELHIILAATEGMMDAVQQYGKDGLYGLFTFPEGQIWIRPGTTGAGMAHQLSGELMARINRKVAVEVAITTNNPRNSS